MLGVALVLAVGLALVLSVLLIRELRTAREAVAALETQSREREIERSRLTDQLLTVEQDERRRLALFLHDTSVQSLSAIAMMLDAAVQSIEAGRLDEARTVLARALERHRATIGALRDLSFNLEPVVLRDQGFEPAVRALAEQLESERELHVDVDIPAADALGSKAQAALYQIIREALDGAVRRGPPSRISVRIEQVDGAIETTIADDAPGERRRALLDAIAERASSLSGTLDVEQGERGGTTLRVSLPVYAAGV
jgi:signal transduction histidine kinase